MPRATLDPIFRAEVRLAYYAASSVPERKRIIENARKVSGFSYGGLMRSLNLKVRKRSLGEEENIRVEALNSYGRIVFEYQLNHWNGLRPVSTRLALRKLKDDGVIPEEVGYHQISASIRRQHLKAKSDSYHVRFERTDPLASVQMDFTRSRHLEHLRKDGKSYYRVAKAKGANAKIDRVWIAVAIDDSSRVAYARYYLAKGENPRLAKHFLLRACKQKGKINTITGEVQAIPLLQGQPKQLYTDRGGAFRNASFQNGLRKMGIELVFGASAVDTEGKKRKASNKQARGKVERFNQFIKQNFEADLLVRSEGAVYTESEINTLLRKWLVMINTSSLPESAEIRWEKFLPALKGASYPPEDAGQLFTNSVFRKVQRRQVRVKTGVWCKVPPEVKNGATIEIIIIDDSYYIFIDQIRILLEVIPSRIKTDNHATPITGERTEFDLDYLGGMALRSRLNREIETRTRQMQNLGILTGRFPKEVEEFISVRRSIKEMKAFVTTLLLNAQKSDQYSISPEGSLVNNSEEEK